ncbi:hypothetical protein Cgig2_012982 [Carnegiea gigantea]|uniref:Uncharacterized protein n=1 Tax=Carnegiea gigantea TaxID=171969 RepID=A0A9Q1GRY0_9CARY|nr:hypothetical protein Cgig2_012982 [Carnegiea gigantea]
MGLGFTMGVLGVLILSHAAYSTVQCSNPELSCHPYRGLLKITEEEFSGPPLNMKVVIQFEADRFILTWDSNRASILMQVVAELILGFLFCLYAGLTVPGKFKSIHPDSEENRAPRCGEARGDGRVASMVVRRGECLKRVEAWASVRLKEPLSRNREINKKPRLTFSRVQTLDENPSFPLLKAFTLQPTFLQCQRDISTCSCWGCAVECRIVSLPDDLAFMTFSHRGRLTVSQQDMKFKL